MADALPFDEEFQLSILAYLWRDAKALTKHAAHIEAGWFESSLNGSLCSIFVDHFTEFRKPPAQEVVREEIRRMYSSEKDDDVRRRAALIERVGDLRQKDISDTEYLDNRIREFIRWCAMKGAIMETFDEFSADVYNEEMPKRFEKALMAGQDDFDTGSNWGNTYQHRLYAYANPDKPRIGTGLKHLDELIGGGLAPGELGILMAVPKGFKSGAMLNFAYNAAGFVEAKNVCYITLELSEDLVGIRFDLRCAQLPKSEIFEDLDRFRHVVSKRKAFYIQNRDIYVKYFPPRGCNCATIRAYLNRMAEEHGVVFDMLVVDYLDLMKSERNREKDYLEAVETCESLRSLGDEFNMPVWTAVRATRDAVGQKRINMRHMSKAFERIGVADLVMAICQTEEEKLAGTLRLATVAARNDAGDKIIHCKVDYSRMTLTSTGIGDIELDDATEDAPRRSGGGGTKKRSEEEEQYKTKTTQMAAGIAGIHAAAKQKLKDKVT